MNPVKIYDLEIQTPFILGSALYPNLQSLIESIQAAKTEMVTVALKRELQGGKNNFFWQAIKKTGVKVLPNTAGCKNTEEALMIAKAAREIFKTNYIKLEIIGDAQTLQPDPIELLKATEVLIKEGFYVLPYCTDDLTICQKLVQMGCKVLMPLASFIGSGQGIQNPHSLALLRNRLPQTTLIVDAGIGTPSDATIAMELGFDAVLLNSAVALSHNPPLMAKAFYHAIQAGKYAYSAKRMPKRKFAHSSTPLEDTPFWHTLST